MNNEINFEEEINALTNEFEGIVKEKLVKKSRDNQKKQLEKSLSNLQESLNYLRVCIKYQVFDLEATRRENEDLRKLLEDIDNERREE